MNKILHFGITARIACVAAVAAAILVSCVKRELYIRPDEGQVEFDFDWQRIAEGETVPDQVSVYLYSDKGNFAPMVSNGKHFSATVPSGKYKVLVLNNKVQGVGFGDMTEYEKAYAYALPLENRSHPWDNKTAGKTDDAWIHQPGWLYCSNIDELTVNTNDTVLRTLIPKPLVQRVRLNIQVGGASESVTGISAALSGVAPSALLSKGCCQGGYTSVTELNPVPIDGGYTANVLVFGVITANEDGSPIPDQIRLNFDFENGGSQEFSVDMKDSDGGTPPGEDGTVNIDIVIVVDIEVSPTSEGGFEAKVTRWEIGDGDIDVDNRPGGVPLKNR